MQHDRPQNPKSFRRPLSIKEILSLLAFGAGLLGFSIFAGFQIFAKMPEKICYYVRGPGSGMTCTSDFGIGSLWIVFFEVLGVLGVGAFGIFIFVILIFQPKKKRAHSSTSARTSYLEMVPNIGSNTDSVKTFPIAGDPLALNKSLKLNWLKQGFWLALIFFALSSQVLFYRTQFNWSLVLQTIVFLLVCAVVIWISLSSGIGKSEMKFFKSLSDRASGKDLVIDSDFLYIPTVHLLWPGNSSAYKMFSQDIIRNRSTYFKIHLNQLDRTMVNGHLLFLDSRTIDPGPLVLQIGDQTVDRVVLQSLNEELSKRTTYKHTIG